MAGVVGCWNEFCRTGGYGNIQQAILKSKEQYDVKGCGMSLEEEVSGERCMRKSRMKKKWTRKGEYRAARSQQISGISGHQESTNNTGAKRQVSSKYPPPPTLLHLDNLSRNSLVPTQAIKIKKNRKAKPGSSAQYRPPYRKKKKKLSTSLQKVVVCSKKKLEKNHTRCSLVHAFTHNFPDTRARYTTTTTTTAAF
ncbi:hypothetical protein COCMIDRAFT_30225 [Bipolaris oryzae ATCC 44560]|uniref:Uncharacterized protein n=1 Tax=Bipolaris oryzae ATCC 44560 TaxID=930090 RepID=W6YZF5_COCMI|nr:uncharacterized protein COCMIDRAFT_30225 [Bipolaris oryzae ATCC 44560]EUC40914.1 hypothetical protein COCMIDRAFT_30225 [Bipolaris oryzae ATCC 44560]